MRNICIMVGARPNFVKVAPIIWAVDKAKADGSDIDYRLVYAGKEDDPTLEPSLFEDLQIPHPDVFLGVDCVSLNELTGKVMAEFEHYLTNNPTDVVIVVDDLASTMAAAIVTKKCNIKLAHIVAGTRSFDMTMPKEINRLVIDGLSDLLFTAGIGASSIATREGAELSQIYMVGNILMDTLRHNHSRLRCPHVLDQPALKDKAYLVLTINRKALINDRQNLPLLVSAIASAAGDTPIIAPVRSPAHEAIRSLCDAHANLHLIEPLTYLEFGYLTAHAQGIVTDSGNVAEEATFNAVPCATLNNYTEHIETVKVGSNELVGEDAKKIQQAIQAMTTGQWKKCALPDRWDGRTAERIVNILYNL